LIAQALGDGCNEAETLDRLVESGVPLAQANRDIQLARKDPLFVAARRLSRVVEKRDWTLDIYAKLAAQSGVLAIPTVDEIDPKIFFRDFYFANRPVKLTGLVDHWPALEKWTLDFLEESLGDTVVEVQGERGKAATYESNKDPHKRHVKLREIIALLRRDEPSNDYYITAYNDTINKQALAPLWSDLGPISVLESSGANDGFFWLGPAGTLTPFHHDLTNNLLVQVAGRKHVRMVPSWEVPRMRNHLHCFSEREPTDFDTNACDLPAMLECTIDKGEAIFLPVGWWHHVTALDQSISMSFTNFAADNDFLKGYPENTTF